MSGLNQNNTNTQQENQAVFYQIESGIPFFTTDTRRFKKLAESMEVADSVLLKTNQERRSLLTAFRYQGKKGQSRASNQGFRVWRIK